jgi:hypothetical protein
MMQRPPQGRAPASPAPCPLSIPQPHHERLVEGAVQQRLAVVIVAGEEAAALAYAQLPGRLLRLHVQRHRVHLPRGAAGWAEGGGGGGQLGAVVGGTARLGPSLGAERSAAPAAGVHVPKRTHPPCSLRPP